MQKTWMIAGMAVLSLGLWAAETPVKISNGNFEQGLTGWTHRGKGPAAPGNIRDFMTVSADAAEGKQAILLNDPWTDCSPYLQLVLKPLPYQQEYVVRCKVKAPAGQPFALGWQFLNPQKFIGGGSKTFTGSGKYEACEFRISRIPAEAAEVIACFYPSAAQGWPARGEMLLDDVQVFIRPNADIKAARTYIVSAAGDDRFDGTAEFPWKSIEKANASLLPGDTVIFRPGRYHGCIAPGRSGAQGAPITYKAEKPGTVFLTGGWSDAFKKITAIGIRDRSHIVINGFSAKDTWNSRWLLLENVTDSEFRNLAFSGSDHDNTLYCRNVHRCRFTNLAAERTHYLRSGQVAADMWNVRESSQCVFEKMHIGKCGHRPFGVWRDCDRLVIRDTVFDCRYGRNFELFNPSHILMERCVLTNAYEGAGSADPRAKLFVNDSIFRRNVIFRNTGIPVSVGCYMWEGKPFGMENSRLYHNTFTANDEAGWEVADLDKLQAVKNNRFVNNIFAFNGRFGGGAGIRYRSVRPDTVAENNLFFGRKAGDTVIRFDPDFLTVQQAEKKFPAMFKKNLDGDPLFANAKKLDFTLKPDSPAINAGAPAAVLTAAADGKTLKVSDGAMFYDGYGIPGEKGDEIVIAGTKAVVVQADAKNNKLTLDRAVKAPEGAEIQFAWAVGKPDLGAFESGSPAASPQVPADCYVPGFDEPHGTYKVDWELDNMENWFYFFHYATYSRSYARVDDSEPGRRSFMVYATDAGGGRGAMPSAKKPLKPGEYGSKLCVSIRPQMWDIDVYPVMKFDYKVPADVEWGVMVMPFAEPGQPPLRRIWLGGTAKRQVGKDPDLKLFTMNNDGKWHTVTVDLRKVRAVMPGVKGFRRVDFCSPRDANWVGHAAPGSRAWIDNFELKEK